MLCPKCRSPEVSVIDSRSLGFSTYRRRHCLDCGNRFSTREIPEDEAKAMQSILNSLAYLIDQAERRKGE